MPVLTSMPSARAAGATTVAPRHRQRAVASASRPPLASTSSRRPQTTVYANGRQSATGLILPQLEAVTDSVSAFSPATVANLGAGFDFMGCAVEGQGDIVTATLRTDLPGQVVIEGISGDHGRLSLEASDNCSGIAALETLKLLGITNVGVSLTLQKGLPLGSGLGSSAASAGAAAVAVNALFGSPVSKVALVGPGLVSESYVSGFHADNVAPAILGGFILIRQYEPTLRMEELVYGCGAAASGRTVDDLWFTLVTPVFEAPTRMMRAALPSTVPFKTFTHNSIASACLVAGVMLGDVEMLGQGMTSDRIVEVARGPLIPGFSFVKQAAMAAGALGCTISGAGPTCVAVTKDKATGIKAAEAMVAAFEQYGKLEVNMAAVVKLSTQGAHVCASDASTNAASAHFVRM